MKKIVKFILPLVLLLSSCGTMDLKKDTTVILDVESEVTPTFAANFGEGSYQNNTYTHHISAQKDLYIYLSYEGLATETVFIPAKEMTESVIRKSVQFGSPLKSIITINADNIEDISKATVETESTVLNTRYDDNNKKMMKLTFSGRNEDIDIVLKADGYKDTKIHIDKSYLKSGLYTARPVFLKSDQVAVSVTNASATIYEYPSGDKVREIWSNGQTTNYIIKDLTKTYYVKYYDQVDGIEIIKLVDKNEGFSIDMPANQAYNQKYLGNLELEYTDESGNKQYIGYKYVVDFKNKTLYPCYGLYQEYLSGGFGLIFQFSTYDSEKGTWENKLYYAPAMESLTFEEQSDEYSNKRYKLLLNNATLDAFETLNSEIKVYDVLNKERLINTYNNELMFNGNFKKFDYVEETKTIKYSFYRYDSSSKVAFNIVNEKGEFLTRYEGNFDNLSINKNIVINKKTRNIRIDLILDLLTYDEATDTYTFPDAVLDTTVNPVTVYNYTNGQQMYLNNVYDHDAKKELKVKEQFYFEGVAGHKITIANNEQAYTVNVTENDIQSGVIIVGGNTLDVKLNTIDGWDVAVDPNNVSSSTLFYELANGDKYLRFLRKDGAQVNLLFTKGDLVLRYSNYYQNSEDVRTNGLGNLTPIFRTNAETSWNESDPQDFFGNYGAMVADQQRWSYLYYEKRIVTPDTLVKVVSNETYTNNINLLEGDYVYIPDFGYKALDPTKYRLVYMDGFSAWEAGINDFVYGNSAQHGSGPYSFKIMRVDTPIVVSGVERYLTEVDGLFVHLTGTVKWDPNPCLDTLTIESIPYADIELIYNW